MLIVLDTNIFQEDFLLRTGRFQVLLDFATRTQSSFLLPRIVLEELSANYERDLRKRILALARAREQLNGILLERDQTRTEVDIGAAVASYISFVKEKLRIVAEGIIQYRPEYLEDVLARAISRRRPCTDRGEEIRDVVLWHSLLDAAEALKEPILFISRNTDQFSADKVLLHPDLVVEAAARGVNLHFVPSLEEFAKQHATKIAFITKEWLEEQIDADAVLDQAYDTLMKSASNAAQRQARWQERVDGGFHIEGGGVEVDEFFVYQMATGEMRVEATWWGTCIVGYDVAVEESYHHSSYSGRYGRSSRSREIAMTIHVVTQVLIRDSGVVEWSKLDAWSEPH